MKMIELSSFDQWFAGSKVVDKHGKPLRCYHGTNSNINTFYSGTHFGTPTAANQRVLYRTKNTDEWERAPKVYPVYLNIKNPLRVTDLIASDESAFHHAICAGKYPKIDRDISWKEGAYKAAEAAGYDGLVYKNGIEDPGKLSWVIFHPSQVRFALSNVSEAVKKFPGLTPNFIKTLQKVRHEQRIENGGGGACHLVSEWIEWKYGWDRVSGIYTTPDYKEPQVTGHYWNLLPDGSILDATADQLGEGHDIIVVHPSDKNYHRYRPEFSHEFDADYSNNPDAFEDYMKTYFPYFDRNTIHRNGDDYEWGKILDKKHGKYLQMQKKLYGYDPMKFKEINEARIMFSKKDMKTASEKSKEDHGSSLLMLVMNDQGNIYIDNFTEPQPNMRKSISFWFNPENKEIQFRNGSLGNKLKPKAQQALRELLKSGLIDKSWKIITSRGLSRYPLVKDNDGRAYRSHKYETEPNPNDFKSIEELTDQAIRLTPASKDLIFYHGTSTLDWEKIQKVGLHPLFKGTNTQHGAESRGKHEGNEGVLYLAATPDKAYDYAKLRVDDQNRKLHKSIYIHNEKNDPVVLEVKIPDPAKLVADDDAVNEVIRSISRRIWQNKSDEEKKEIMNTWNFKFRPKDFDIAYMLWREHDEGFKEIMAQVPKRVFAAWRASLMRHHQVGYKGIIPPKFLKRIE